MGVGVYHKRLYPDEKQPVAEWKQDVSLAVTSAEAAAELMKSVVEHVFAILNPPIQF